MCGQGVVCASVRVHRDEPSQIIVHDCEDRLRLGVRALVQDLGQIAEPIQPWHLRSKPLVVLEQLADGLVGQH